jgi:hypothetical protein
LLPAHGIDPEQSCKLLATGLGLRSRHVIARTSSKVSIGYLALAPSTTPAWTRSRKWLSTSLADAYAILQKCNRSLPDLPCPSARFAGTELADRMTWSAIDFRGAGTLMTSAMAAPAASRAFEWAMRSDFARTFDKATSPPLRQNPVRYAG